MKSLKTEKEFKEILKMGKPEYCEAGKIYKMGAKEPGLGIITSRKLGSAIERNRIKRRIKEAFKIAQTNQIKAKILLIPNKNSMKLDFKRLVEAIKRHSND